MNFHNRCKGCDDLILTFIKVCNIASQNTSKTKNLQAIKLQNCRYHILKSGTAAIPVEIRRAVLFDIKQIKLRLVHIRTLSKAYRIPLSDLNGLLLDCTNCLRLLSKVMFTQSKTHPSMDPHLLILYAATLHQRELPHRKHPLYWEPVYKGIADDFHEIFQIIYIAASNLT